MNGGYTQTYSSINTECGEIESLWKNKQGDGDAYFKVGERMMSPAGGCQSKKGMRREMPEEKNCCRRV